MHSRSIFCCFFLFRPHRADCIDVFRKQSMSVSFLMNRTIGEANNQKVIKLDCILTMEQFLFLHTKLVRYDRRYKWKIASKLPDSMFGADFFLCVSCSCPTFFFFLHYVHLIDLNKILVFGVGNFEWEFILYNEQFHFQFAQHETEQKCFARGTIQHSIVICLPCGDCQVPNRKLPSCIFI